MNANTRIADELKRLAQQVEDGATNEVLKLHTNIRIELRGPDGNLKDEREIHNLICTIGKQQILKASAAKYLNQFAYCGIGTGTNAAAIGDTILQTEVSRSAVITPTNPDANTLQFVATFGAGVGTGAITESGLLDAAAAGNLLARQVFAVVNKGAGDTLTMTWSLT